MNSKKITIRPSIPGRQLQLKQLLTGLCILLIIAISACAPSTPPTDSGELDAQQDDELAQQQAAQDSEAFAISQKRITDQETAMARGFSERDDFVGTFVGQWLIEGHPARQVILALKEDDTAALSTQETTPGNETEDTGTWKFANAGEAMISLNEAGELELNYIDDKGIFLSGGEFGDEGISMLLYDGK